MKNVNVTELEDFGNASQLYTNISIYTAGDYLIKCVRRGFGTLSHPSCMRFSLVR